MLSHLHNSLKKRTMSLKRLIMKNQLPHMLRKLSRKSLRSQSKWSLRSQSKWLLRSQSKKSLRSQSKTSSLHTPQLIKQNQSKKL